MHVPANVPYVFLSDSIEVLASYFFVNHSALPFTRVFHCFPFGRII
jgi:hypothetical protein